MCKFIRLHMQTRVNYMYEPIPHNLASDIYFLANRKSVILHDLGGAIAPPAPPPPPPSAAATEYG